jgi:hypothetical protein
LIAVYADNSLREWHLKPSRKMVSRLLGSVQVDPSSAIGYHESGQPWMRIGREWLFLEETADGTWSIAARFPIKDSIAEPTPRGSLMTLVEREGNGTVLVRLIDMTRQIHVASAVANLARYSTVLGTEAFVWSDARVGVRIRRLRPEKRVKDIVLRSPEPSCLDAMPLTKQSYLIAIGTSEGRVCVWQLQLQDRDWSDRKIVDLLVHDGPVTSVVFKTTTKLASGSSDRSIALVSWNESGDGLATIERRLLLKLRCRGMKITGLETEKERSQLAKLIKEADART